MLYRLCLLLSIAIVASPVLATDYYHSADGTVDFVRPNGVDPSDPDYWGVISTNVAIARANTQGIYNSFQETSYGIGSPTGTLWYIGGTVQDVIDGIIAPGDFEVWVEAVDMFPPGSVNVDSVLYLIAEDAYVDFRFTSWQVGPGGGFAYTRAVTDFCKGVQPDCNNDGIADACQNLEDCDENGVPDECEDPLPDCNGDGVADACQDLEDCDGNGIPDECEGLADCNDDGIADVCQGLEDCDENGVPDECEDIPDCNGDGIHDACRSEADCDRNGVPDTCEGAVDLNGNGVGDVCECLGNVFGATESVDVTDLVFVLSHWGPCGDCRSCPDLTGDCEVDVHDLLGLLTLWGPCGG